MDNVATGVVVEDEDAGSSCAWCGDPVEDGARFCSDECSLAEQGRL